jgi:hypothetical protein
MPGSLAGVKIVAADLAKENLAFHAEAARRDRGLAGLDEASDHLELRRER